uniref:Pre-mRNA-splicing factor 38 n=1 Tax=Alexandrium monilatum TaxID=311494 RepID=A0A7S4T2A5_9DINO
MPPMPFMPQTMLQHPMMVAMASTPPVPRPAQVRQAPAREPPPQREPPKPAKAKPPPPAKEEPKEERKEEKKEEKKKKTDEEEDQESVRCHLHRKPQMNCKICRRIYYSALDPSMHKRDERGKDKLSSDKARRGDDDFPGGRRRGAEAFEITNKQTFNFNTMLRDQILKNTYFKSLVNIETFEGIVDEMYQYAESAEVYGAGTTTVPSTLFCCLFRFFTIGISYDELQQLLETRDWPYIRCCGFLYIRFGCAPEKLWDQLGDYCLDDQEFEPSKAQNFTISVGEYVEALLMDERYYYTTLPRIPVGVKKKIEERVAPLSQYRKRTAANRKALNLFREPGTLVEACVEGDWREGVVVQLVETFPTRLMVRVRLEDGTEETAHLGKVILRDDRRVRRRSRSRSRSPRRAHSPDWTRHRGKTQEEMLQELRARQRERAVCSSGKDYARKPIGFMSGLALKRDVGVASTRLREEETYAPRQVEHRRQMTEEEEMERRKEERDRQLQDREKQKQLQQLYEKYGTNHPNRPGGSEQPPGTEEPEVLRLG